MVAPLSIPTTLFASSSSSSFTNQFIYQPLQFPEASFLALRSHSAPLGLHASKIGRHHRSVDSRDNIGCTTMCRASSISVPVSETGWLFPLFQDIGINEKEADGLLEKHPDLKCRSFDSLKLRIVSLRSIGFDTLALYRLIIKFPDLLTATEVEPFVNFISNYLDGEVKSAQLERLLASTDPRFLVGFERKVKLLLHHGIPREKLGYVLNNVSLAKAICLRSYEQIDRSFSCLKPFGGEEIIVKCPLLLNYDFETQLLPKIEYWKYLSGGDVEATGTLFRKLPAILKYSLEHVQDHVLCLRSTAGLTDLEVFKVFLGYPNTISASRERKLAPRVEFLKECGLDSHEIFKFLIRAPCFLGLGNSNVMCKVSFLVKLGYKYRTKEFVTAMASVTRTSCENFQKVIDLFLSYGLSGDEIFIMSKKHPQILQYNHNSLEEKLEYLIDGMGRDVKELLSFPAFLGYKLDDRIKSRYEEKRETRGEAMSINKLLTVSAESFSRRKNSSEGKV